MDLLLRSACVNAFFGGVIFSIARVYASFLHNYDRTHFEILKFDFKISD